MRGRLAGGASLAGAFLALATGSANAGFVPAPGSPFATGGNSASSLALGDVNGDGRLDLVATMQSGSDAVLLGNGAGSLSPAAGSPFGAALAGNMPNNVSLGDVDGNGTLDLAHTNFAPNQARTLLNSGAPGLALAPGSPFNLVSDNSASGTALGDLDRDGVTDDLVIARTIPANQMAVDVYTGQGGGTFAPPVTYDANVDGNGLRRVRLGDVNGDGALDIVIGLNAIGRFDVLLNSGTGTFGAGALKVVPGATGSANEIALGDLNLDGHLDVVVRDAVTPPRLFVMLGNGAGGFALAPGSPRTVPQFNGGGDAIDSLAVDDMNADGRPDVVAGAFSSPNVALMLGDGTGAVSGPTILPAMPPFNNKIVAVGDFNGDVQPDIAALGEGGNQAVVLLNTDAAAIGAAPSSLGFGTQTLGTTSAASTVTLTNVGTGRLRFGTALVAGAAAGDFHLVDDGCSGRTLLVGQPCSVRLAFRPGAAGERSAHLSVPSNAPGSPTSIPVGGTGVAGTASAPVIRVSITNRRFAVARKVTPLRAAQRRRIKLGTRIRVRISEAAQVRIRVLRRSPGRRVRGRCVKQTRRNRGRARCTRIQRRHTLTRNGRAGANAYAYTGRVRSGALKPGRYQFAISARNAAGRRSAEKTIRFRIVRR